MYESMSICSKAHLAFCKLEIGQQRLFFLKNRNKKNEEKEQRPRKGGKIDKEIMNETSQRA